MATNSRLSGQVAARAHHSPAAALLRRVEPFFAIGQVSGGPLLIATIVALVVVNSPWGAAWTAAWDGTVRLSYTGHAIARSAAEWVNDALMPLFFLIIGTEVKREFAKGSLSSVRTAVFPVAGAIGGLVVPIAFYLAFNLGTPTVHGWGVVAAMDTAFSLAIVAMFTTRLPDAVRAVLLAFAAIDDVFGLLVIAIAYTASLAPPYLLLAAIGYAGIVVLLRLRWVAPVPYVLLGCWYGRGCWDRACIPRSQASPSGCCCRPARGCPSAASPSGSRSRWRNCARRRMRRSRRPTPPRRKSITTARRSGWAISMRWPPRPTNPTSGWCAS